MGTTAERLAGSGNKRLRVNAKEYDAQTVAISKKLRKLTGQFTLARKRQVAKAGAAPVRKVARQNTKRLRKGKVHYDYVPGKAEGAKKAGKNTRLNDRVEYRKGNLRKSIQTMTWRGSKDAFVGPKRYKGKRKAGDVFGLTAKKVDPYYAAMAYGSEANFNRKVLATAKSQAGAQSYIKMAAKTRQIVEKYYKQTRLK